MKKLNKASIKYLEQYSEPIAKAIADSLSDHQWNQSIVIPCHMEAELVRELLYNVEAAANHTQGKTLCVLCINQRESASEYATENNLKTGLIIRDFFQNQVVTQQENFYLLRKSCLDILVIECFQAPFFFPSKQGVGLARKLITDIAFNLFCREQIKSPWCFNTDADVLIPDDYFNTATMKTEDQTAAIICDFEHHPHPSLTSYEKEALSLYDKHLHYYKESLEQANSPYGFYTIGSTIGINLNKYPLVRGYPKKKQAGEDFYILNKLAKVGVIANHHCKPLRILGRPSQRVPFGTGPSIIKIAEDLKNGLPYLSYHPLCFQFLKRWLKFCLEFLESSSPSFAEYWGHQSHKLLLTDESNFFSFLDQFDAFNQLEKMKKLGNQKKLKQKQFHDWFDAFKTLKLIHFLREHEFPSIEKPWAEIRGCHKIT